MLLVDKQFTLRSSSPRDLFTRVKIQKKTIFKGQEIYVLQNYSSVEKLTKTTAKSEIEDPCEVEFMSACCKQVL